MDADIVNRTWREINYRLDILRIEWVGRCCSVPEFVSLNQAEDMDVRCRSE